MAMFWSPGIARSMICHSLPPFPLLIQTMSGNLYFITLSVWILKFRKILFSPLPWTDYGVCVCVCVYVCVPLFTDTKSFLYLAWVPLVLAVAIYFHHQCFLVRSRTDHEEASLSIWSDVVFFSFVYFIAFLNFSSAVAVMVSFSVLLRVYSNKFCLSSLTQSSILKTSLPPLLLQSSAKYLEQNREIQ